MLALTRRLGTSIRSRAPRVDETSASAQRIIAERQSARARRDTLRDTNPRVLPGFESETVPDRVLGRAYIPDALADGVVKEPTQKGRLFRRVVDVERLDGQGSEVVRAFSGCGNPNFWWGDDGSGLNLDRAAVLSQRLMGRVVQMDYLRNLADFCVNKDTISTLRN